VFAERFGKAAWEWRQEPWTAARTNLQHGRPEAALSSYYEAIERQPGNWILLNETAWYLTHLLGKPALNLAMARAAVALNPACSAELYNTLGDASYALGKMAEAKGAYRRPLRGNPNDVRGRFGLSAARLPRGVRARLRQLQRGPRWRASRVSGGRTQTQQRPADERRLLPELPALLERPLLVEAIAQHLLNELVG
jgi:tetratricopeptide (TPR) repeat protein